MKPAQAGLFAPCLKMIRASFWCWLLLLPAAVVGSSPSAFAQDLKTSVAKKVSPEDWLQARTAANREKWKKTDSVTPEMTELLFAAAQDIAPKGESGKPADRAAANLAFSVVSD